MKQQHATPANAPDNTSAMLDENMRLWSAVERTDPKHTKAITGKPYKGTSPSPYYLVRKATETFGPCGIGWGFGIKDQQMLTGRDGTMIHVATIRVWYIWNGQTGEVEHVGQTVFSGKNKNGDFTDEDACKKSITDGLVKALSMIGFAGDIFIGRYDDSKYVAELREEHAPPKLPNMEHVAYASDFRTELANATRTDEIRHMWSAQRVTRERIGLADTDPLAGELHKEWLARGLELKAAENKDAA